VSLQVWAFLKSEKKTKIMSALGLYHPVVFFYLTALEKPTASVPALPSWGTPCSGLADLGSQPTLRVPADCQGCTCGLSRCCWAASEHWGFTHTLFWLYRLSDKPWDQTLCIALLLKRAWFLAVFLKRAFHFFLLNENDTLRMTYSEYSDSLQFLR